MKICTKCTFLKHLDEFHRDRNKKDGRARYCFKCHSQMAKPGKQRAKRKYTISQYGLTEETFNEMLTRQYGECLICGVHFSELHKNLSIDHDHKTKKVRGLLCNSCNIMIGYAKESPMILRHAAAYLELHLPINTR